jgi:hypothetical protein
VRAAEAVVLGAALALMGEISDTCLTYVMVI